MYESAFFVLLLLISLLVPYEIFISLRSSNRQFHFPLHLKSEIDAYHLHIMRKKKSVEKVTVVRKIKKFFRRKAKHPIS